MTIASSTPSSTTLAISPTIASMVSRLMP